jgi:hypothetical protein
MCPKVVSLFRNKLRYLLCWRFQTYANSTYCDRSCPVGKSTSFSGSTVFQLCTYGRYSEPPTQSRCDPCPLGKYKPFNGASVCIDCLGFHLTNSTGSTTSAACIDECIAGTFPSGIILYSVFLWQFLISKSKFVLQALSGRYGSTLGVTSLNQCQLCSTGTYNLDSGSTSVESCRACVAGEGIHCSEGSGAI